MFLGESNAPADSLGAGSGLLWFPSSDDQDSQVVETSVMYSDSVYYFALDVDPCYCEMADISTPGAPLTPSTQTESLLIVVENILAKVLRSDRTLALWPRITQVHLAVE